MTKADSKEFHEHVEFLSALGFRRALSNRKRYHENSAHMSKGEHRILVEGNNPNIWVCSKQLDLSLLPVEFAEEVLFGSGKSGGAGRHSAVQSFLGEGPAHRRVSLGLSDLTVIVGAMR